MVNARLPRSIVFTSFLSRHTDSLWKRYAIALSLIFATVVVGHLLEFQALKNARHDAEMINLSGKQRMLSQRIIAFSQAYHQDQDPIYHRTLKASIDEFESAHTFLTIEAHAHPELNQVYSSGERPLAPMVETYIEQARALAQGLLSTAEQEVFFELGTGPLLQRLDDAVTAFEQLSKQNALRVTRLQEVTLLMAIFVILLEALLIFIPAQKFVRQSVKQLEQAIQDHEETNQRLSNYVNIAADIYWETDLAANITFVEGRFLKHMQGTRDALIGCNYSDLITLDDDSMHKILSARKRSEAYEDVEATFINSEGISHVLRMSGMPRYDRDGKLVGYLGKANDVTDEVTILGEVTRLSLTDPLTDVANKRAFERDLTLALQDASEARPVTLMAIDLDSFKPINDTFGHGAGDEVIKIIAARIKTQLRSDSWVARTGGDEFCVVCQNMNADPVSQHLADRINAKITEPIYLSGGNVVHVGVSIGIAEAPLHATKFDEFLEAADIALYHAKRAGGNQIKTYSTQTSRVDLHPRRARLTGMTQADDQPWSPQTKSKV